MNAPDRSAWVMEIWKNYPPVMLVNGAFPSDEERRVYLLDVLLPRLRGREPYGTWGCLIKTDQNDKIPADIAVWKDTKEHFDVLTDTGPIWKPHGPAKKAWIFGDVSTIPYGDEWKPPPPPDPPAVDLMGRLEALEFEVKLLKENKADKSRVEAINKRFADESENFNVHYPLPDYVGSRFGITITSKPKP